MIESTADQVRLVVDSISHALHVEVCSLYLCRDDHSLELLASHGLETGRRKVRIPAERGLVGLVVRSRRAVNIANPQQHPDFYFVAGSNESRFHSFCGVPLVRTGEVIGVLVAQSCEAQALSSEDEAFLATLASQLALIIGDRNVTVDTQSAVNVRTFGVKGAPGIGIGSAQLCDSGDLANIQDAACTDIEASIEEWRNLLVRVHAEIESEKAAVGDQVSSGVTAIFDTYRMLLSDRSFLDQVETEIRDGHWLPAALRRTVDHFAKRFAAMDDAYLRARSEDIRHIGDKLFDQWRGVDPERCSNPDPEEKVVLVGSSVSVSSIARIPLQQLAGVVCFEGSSMSHTAVLASAMGVPAVMGVDALRGIKSGDRLVVDGNRACVYFNPAESLVAEYQQLIEHENELSEHLRSLRDLPGNTTDGTEIRLFTNTGLLADITPGLQNGAQGVGLYRTEIPFMVRDSFPTEEEQFTVYSKVIAAYAGKPVYMRTLDIGGDKQLPYFPIRNEENPALGWRGIRFTLDNIQLLMTQVRAMIRASVGFDNLHLLLPMVSSTAELVRFSGLLDDACTQLAEEGLNFQRPRVGAMLEVPAAISQLRFWKPYLDFISIGSNDLSQYLLALDRNNSRVASRYDHAHPAVLSEIERIFSIAKTLNIPVSLCGEMAADPVCVILLLGIGLRTLSMSAAKLLRIKWLIRKVSIARCEELFTSASQLDDVASIRSLVEREIHELGLEDLISSG